MEAIRFRSSRSPLQISGWSVGPFNGPSVTVVPVTKQPLTVEQVVIQDEFDAPHCTSHELAVPVELQSVVGVVLALVKKVLVLLLAVEIKLAKLETVAEPVTEPVAEPVVEAVPDIVADAVAGRLTEFVLESVGVVAVESLFVSVA